MHISSYPLLCNVCVGVVMENCEVEFLGATAMVDADRPGTLIRTEWSAAAAAESALIAMVAVAYGENKVPSDIFDLHHYCRAVGYDIAAGIDGIELDEAHHGSVPIPQSVVDFVERVLL